MARKESLASPYGIASWPTARRVCRLCGVIKDLNLKEEGSVHCEYTAPSGFPFLDKGVLCFPWLYLMCCFRRSVSRCPKSIIFPFLTLRPESETYSQREYICFNKFSDSFTLRQTVVTALTWCVADLMALKLFTAKVLYLKARRGGTSITQSIHTQKLTMY